MTRDRAVVRSTCRWTKEAVVRCATLRDWRSFPGQLLVVALVVVSGVAFYLIQRKNKLAALVHEPSAEAVAISDAPSMRAEAIAWRFVQKEDKNGGGRWKNS